jgi:hypothetical protein
MAIWHAINGCILGDERSRITEYRNLVEVLMCPDYFKNPAPLDGYGVQPVSGPLRKRLKTRGEKEENY